MGAAFPSLRPGSQARQAASFRLSAIKRGQFDVANQNIVSQARIALASAKGNPELVLRRASAPFASQAAAQKKAEQQFKQAQVKAESDFIARIQSAISKQLESFTVPQQTQQPIQPIFIQTTPMIESDSQIKQEQQSPIPLIPLAIIGVILGAVLLG